MDFFERPSSVPPLATPAPPAVAQLPVRLRDLMRREVCLEISRSHLESALMQIEREAEQLRKTRPPFLMFQGKSARSEFEARQTSATETQASLTRGLQSVAAAQPRLRAWVEDDLETFLRDSQPAYLHGLATHRFPEDWQRAVNRFDQRLGGLRAAFNQLQSALAHIPAGSTIATHAPAFEALMTARQWGVLFDYEFLFFNRVADIQRRLVRAGNTTLTRTADQQFGQQIGKWARNDGPSVSKALLELRAQIELASMDARTVYAAEAARATPGGGPAPVPSFVTPMWEALRQLTRLEIDPTQVEQIVAETERMVAAAGP
jgi:hypothetical protein